MPKSIFLFQKATEKVLKEDKDELYRKLLATYESRKKMGLSSDLARKLRRRRKLRRMRHHRKSKRKLEIFVDYFNLANYVDFVGIIKIVVFVNF